MYFRFLPSDCTLFFNTKKFNMKLAYLTAILALSSVVSQSDLPIQGDDAQLWTCQTNYPRQSWYIEPASVFPYNHIVINNSYNSSVHGWLVLDIGAWSNSTGAEVHVWYNTTGNQGYV